MEIVNSQKKKLPKKGKKKVEENKKEIEREEGEIVVKTKKK